MRKIRVLMVAGSMHVGGIENQLMHVVRNADKEKFQIDFTSTIPEANYRKEIEALGSRFLVIPDMDWHCPMKYCKAMYSIMKDGKYDIVHSHELFHSGVTLLIAKKAGVPCRFAHAHNWQDSDGTGGKRTWIRSCYNAVMRRLINSCSTVQIACSTWAGEFVYGKKILSKDSYHLLYNSVDTKRFLDRYDDMERRKSETDGWKNVLNVARITDVKNQLFLTEIAEELKKRKTKIRILCAGNGDADVIQKIKRRIEQQQLQEYMQLLGVRNDIDSLLRQASAFVLPSKYEGMPLVMIEAQASGLTCVSADTYSPEVDFGLGRIIWLSLNQSVEDWADALEMAVNTDRVEKLQVEQAIRGKGFDSRIFAKRLCDLYEKDYICRKGTE